MKTISKIKITLWIFIIILIASGITAFPIQWELNILNDIISNYDYKSDLVNWLQFVIKGVNETYSKYPFVAYGTDWLAFAHIIIAIYIYGAIKNPIQNQWLIKASIIACILIIPLALIAGQIREIPFMWRLLDCSFGIIGIAPLLFVNNWINKMKISYKSKMPKVLKIKHVQ